MYRYSFLLPTRKRPDLIEKLFKSIVETTSRLDELEVILAVDEDDPESQAITHDKIHTKIVIMPPGVSMGALNRACFAASSGRFVMVMNDDIIIRTKGWDQIIGSVLADHPDDVVLVHVNDLLFREKLCTFPLLSRRACLEIGLCPEEYYRYRIDDHIYDTYSMLSFLGHKRIIYLPDVIFEHENHVQNLNEVQDNDHAFESDESKIYVPNKKYIDADAKVFEQKLIERKEAAMKLARLIDSTRLERLTQSRERSAQQLQVLDAARQQRAYTSSIADVKDSYSYRRGDLYRKRQTLHMQSGRTPRTTIAVVTSDLRKGYANKCLNTIKDNTTNYDLMILDNGGTSEFKHAREMNRVMRACETDYLVLLDDDIYVEDGWLEKLFACLDDETGLVVPMHVDGGGTLSYSGMYFAGDGKGAHEHLIDPIEKPRETPIVCSAAMLMDLRKVGHIFMDEIYVKYFFDLVYSLEVWEAGYKVVVAPGTFVTHLGGATMIRGSLEANAHWQRDRQLFAREWVASGRLGKLETGIWQRFPFIQRLIELPRRINALTDAKQFKELERFQKELLDMLVAVGDYPQFRELLMRKLDQAIPRYQEQLDDRRAKLCLGAYAKLLTAVDRRKTLPYVLHMADQLLAKGRLQSALDVVEEGLAVEEHNPALLKRKGVILFLAGRPMDAEEAFVHAQILAPRDGDIAGSLGRLYFEGGDFREALRQLRIATSAKPEDIDSWLRMEAVARQLNETQILREIHAYAKYHPQLAGQLASNAPA